MAISRRGRRRVKIILVLLALCAGLLVAAEARYATLRLKDIEVSSPELIPQKAVWGTLSVREEECWPVFWLSSRNYVKLIESYYPVNASVSLRGWGKFRLNVEPLEPVFKMYWGGRFWYVSREGKAWLALLDDNKYIETAQCDSRPVVSWSSDRTTPLDLTQNGGNIYTSSLPVDRILEWYARLDAIGWTRHVKYVQAGMREGSPVVRLVFLKSDGSDGVNMLFNDDPSHWLESALAVKKLYPDTEKISSEIFIDTTYKGKILVKNIVK